MACLSSKTRPKALYKHTWDTHKENEWVSQAAALCGGLAIGEGWADGQNPE